MPELLAVIVGVADDVALAVLVLLEVGLAVLDAVPVGLLLGVLVDVWLLVPVLEAVGVAVAEEVAPEHSDTHTSAQPSDACRAKVTCYGLLLGSTILVPQSITAQQRQGGRFT